MTNANDTAYPRDYNVQNDGLTKREYFTAMALQGLLASYSPTSFPDAKDVAEWTIKYADALINELNKTI